VLPGRTRTRAGQAADTAENAPHHGVVQDSRTRLWWLVAVVAGCASGCAAADPPVRACTEIGSPPGVTVTVERAAVAESLRLTLRICQNDCLERVVDLQPGSVTVGETCSSDDPDGSCSASASPDGTLVGFVDVSDLAEGAVRVSGALRAAGATTTFDEVTVSATPTHPNGPDCPAGGPQAAVRVTPTALR